MAELAGVITPFPGGVCRSGSKVGSKYKALVASTAEAYCPTLRDRVKTELVDGAQCAYEIVIDGVDQAAVAAAMRVAIEAVAPGEGVLAIGAGNYGGKLGKYPIHLHALFISDDAALESRARVAVVGTSCAGKSTLGPALRDRLNCSPHRARCHYWGPNWTPDRREQFRNAYR